MADAIIANVAGQLISVVTNQIKNEIHLVIGADKELLDLSDKLYRIRSVLGDAEMKQFKDKTVNDWLQRLGQTSYEMEDVLDEWNYAILQQKMEYESASARHKVCSFIPSSSCSSFKKLGVRHDISKKIQNLKSRFHEILNERDLHNFVITQPKSDPFSSSSRVQSTSLIDSAEVRGRNDDKDILVSKLIATRQGLGYHILSIVGAGGLGKTTLAQLVYNDSQVIQCFGELRIWICVYYPFDVAVIAKEIIKSITRESSPDTTQLDDLLRHLIGLVSGKKILLVLDDVWNEQEDKWEPLKSSLQYSEASSRILVTTRKENVAKIMGVVDEDIHRPELLSEEDCWLLLRRSATLVGRKEIEFGKIGKAIAKKCKGLPLAAKTLGSLLRFKNTVEEWKSVLKSEIWELEKAEVEIFPHLLLSYHELSPTLKRCFSFCAFFPKDAIIKVENLERIWMALGYLGSNEVGNARVRMELKGREHFNDLAMRSLFQEFVKDDLNEQILTCKMHDIVHDFAQFLRRNEREETSRMIKQSCRVCNPILVARVQEYHCLFWKEESTLSICDCLASLRVLGLLGQQRSSRPQGMEKLIHLRWLNISGTALSMEDVKIICKLYFLQTLLLENCSLKEIPGEIENLAQLRHLDLRSNGELHELTKSICSLYELQTLLLARCHVKEIPREIGNLVELRHLDLQGNDEIRELPKSMRGLIQLKILDVNYCSNLQLPQWIHRLENLEHLLVAGLSCVFPQGLARLSSLRTLNVPFQGGSGLNKLGLLKNLNLLSGSLLLFITIRGTSDLEELVEDAREAELWNKERIRTLTMLFEDYRDDQEECTSTSSLWVEVIKALNPNHRLENLVIRGYAGSRLPHWISSPLNLVKMIELHCFSGVKALPPMGNLRFLEKLCMRGLDGLKVVGAEWLGIRGNTTRGGILIRSSSPTTAIVAFPRLKYLEFILCSDWEEWEDITAEEEEEEEEEEEGKGTRLMPSLTHLKIRRCPELKMLPHRLLRKAESLQELQIISSPELRKCYQDRDGFHWRSISQCNPQLRLKE